MTTIAWDGRVLAADRRMTWDLASAKRPIVDTKVFRLANNNLFQAVAFCGNGDWFHAWLLQLEANDYSLPGEGVSATLIDHLGGVWNMEKSGHPCPVEAPWGDGSGGNIALGAMAAGATAIEAVLIASKYDTQTGDEVDSIEIVTE